jgi:hypothetical protein
LDCRETAPLEEVLDEDEVEVTQPLSNAAAPAAPAPARRRRRLVCGEVMEGSCQVRTVG